MYGNSWLVIIKTAYAEHVRTMPSPIPSRTMSTTQSTNKTVSPDNLSELPRGTSRLGIDSEGRTHRVGCRPSDNGIYVIDEKSIKRYPIDELPVDVDGWMDHVAHKTGWEQVLYEVGLVERLAEVIDR